MKPRIENPLPSPPYSCELYSERLRSVVVHKNTMGIRACGKYDLCALTGFNIVPKDMCLILRWREHILPVSYTGMDIADIEPYWKNPEPWMLTDLLERSRPLCFETIKRWLTQPSAWIQHPDGMFRWLPVEEVIIVSGRNKRDTLSYHPENKERPWKYKGKHWPVGKVKYYIGKKIWMLCNRTEKEFWND